MPPPSSHAARRGRYVESVLGGERIEAYVPDPLPPDPPVDLELARPDAALGIHDRLEHAPYVTATSLAGATGLSSPTVRLGELEKLGLLREVTGRRRGKVFAYSRYVEILAEGTEPL